MGGLVGNYMGAAVGKSMADVGNMMFKGREAEIDRAEKRAARIEDLDRQEVLRRDLAQQQADLRRELAAGRGESGGGGGVSDIPEGSLLEEAMAARAGMLVPEFQKWRKANKTGDYSAFKVDSPLGLKDVNEDAEGFLSFTPKKEYPPGFEQEVASKLKTLGELFTEAVQGDKYKSTMEARQTKQQMDLTQRALDNPNDAPNIARATAAAEGDPLYEGDSNVTREKFSGKTDSTAFGRALEEKNRREPVANARADAAAQRVQITAHLQSLKAEGKTLESQIRELRIARDNETKKMSSGRAAEARARYEPELKRLNEELTDLVGRQRQFSDMLLKLGDNGPATRTGSGPTSRGGPRGKTADAPKGGGQTIDALPANSKEIGTSGGKPVWQTPDGKLYIGK